jgi:hypothetical protein
MYANLNIVKPAICEKIPMTCDLQSVNRNMFCPGQAAEVEQQSQLWFPNRVLEKQQPLISSMKKL